MEKMGLNEIREAFLSFFESKEHYRHQSFSLVPPPDDKSLLIINSGMAPLKPFFAGTEKPIQPRYTTCQKCIRTGDIDNVGITKRHGTFFEMLGNFSFGDYFRNESLAWGVEFITDVLKMDFDRVWATVFEDDDESVETWKSLGMPEERIVRLGRDDNFWQIGLGPCGPCTEIYYDRGPEYGCGKPDCKPGCDCDRYLEFWNHVLSQFDAQEDGTYKELEHKNIDTGMGLERMACIMQGVDSIFDIDTIRHILDAVVAKAGVEYKDGSGANDVSIRVITDHIRSVTFMISDGIMPSNEGRGYVLRRLLRRAARHGRLLGIQGAFLVDLVDEVAAVSGGAYPELIEKKDYIKKVVAIEEEKFAATIEQGENIINDYVAELKNEGKTVLDGDKVFKLYDTYGFPIELTEEILAENGITADVEGFQENMKIQKETARAARKDVSELAWKDAVGQQFGETPTEFTGYEKMVDDAKVIAIIDADGEKAHSAQEGDVVRVILDKTPFYGEGGGQAADHGNMRNDDVVAEVKDVQKSNGVFVHLIEVKSGILVEGDTVSCKVCPYRRNSTARNHTATHLLQAALKEVLGDHINQAGSSVTKEGLRFDFTHFEAISAEDLKKIEEIINKKILQYIPVTTEVMSIKDARESGAMALFGEKYGESVRVVSIGDFSKELCGGTHAGNTGEIGAFHITSETGVAAGVRRIEAITGTNILDKEKEDEAIIAEAADILKTNPAGLVAKLAAINEELKAARKEIAELKKATMGGASDMMAEAEEINGVKVILKSFDDVEINDLRAMSDDIKKDNKNVIMVFAAVNGGKVTFMVSITDDLLEKYHAGKMIKEIAAAAGGGGGGKADMAQAGAKDASKVPAAFDVARGLI